MKLVINFDFINAVFDANEKFSLKKITRNHKKTLTLLGSSIFVFDYVVTENIPVSLLLTMAQCSNFYLVLYYTKNMRINDVYKNVAVKRLNELAQDFKNLYLETNYDLLLKSELISQNYKIILNESKLPILMENKFLLVPTFDFNGNVKETGILQEHEVGSNDYVLSLGKPKKQTKFAYSSI